MLSLATPWALALLPLPLLVWRFVPPHHTRVAAVRAPFFERLLALSGAQPGQGAIVLRRPWLRLLGLSAVWALLVLTLASPTWIGEPRTVERSARDMLLAVDLSGSMQRRDFPTSTEPVSRLDGVKTVLDGFLSKRQGDRLALVVFGEAPFVQSPFTQDATLVRALLDESTVGMAGKQTVIGDAIGLALRVFERSDASSRVMVLLTDGNDTGSLVPPLQAARLAAGKGVTIHVIGVGDPTSAGEDPLDEATLRAIAERTGGQYGFAGDEATLGAIYERLDALEPITFESRTWTPERPVHHLPFALALIIAFLNSVGWLISTGWHLRGAR